MQGAKSAISNLLYGSSVCTNDKCLIVSLVFSHLGFWSGNLFLIAPFPDLCLLVPSLRACVDKKMALVGQGISEKKIFENVTVRTHADSSTIL